MLFNVNVPLCPRTPCFISFTGEMFVPFCGLEIGCGSCGKNVKFLKDKCDPAGGNVYPTHKSGWISRHSASKIAVLAGNPVFFYEEESGSTVSIFLNNYVYCYTHQVHDNVLCNSTFRLKNGVS